MAATAVCVPGLGLGTSAWSPTVAALPGGPHRIVPLPGYGARPAAEDDLDPAALGRRLADLLIGQPSPVVLLGHSASCQVVAHAAALAPHRVSALVLVGPTTDGRARSWPALAARWVRTALWERPHQVPFLARSYAHTGLGHITRTMDAARHDDILDPLASVACRVLVIRGRHDRICPQDWAGRVAAHGAPGSVARTLSAGAHMVPLTHGPHVAAAVQAPR